MNPTTVELCSCKNTNPCRSHSPPNHCGGSVQIYGHDNGGGRVDKFMDILKHNMLPINVRCMATQQVVAQQEGGGKTIDLCSSPLKVQPSSEVAPPVPSPPTSPPSVVVVSESSSNHLLLSDSLPSLDSSSCTIAVGEAERDNDGLWEPTPISDIKEADADGYGCCPASSSSSDNNNNNLADDILDFSDEISFSDLDLKELDGIDFSEDSSDVDVEMMSTTPDFAASISGGGGGNVNAAASAAGGDVTAPAPFAVAPPAVPSSSQPCGGLDAPAGGAIFAAPSSLRGGAVVAASSSAIIGSTAGGSGRPENHLEAIHSIAATFQRELRENGGTMTGAAKKVPGGGQPRQRQHNNKVQAPKPTTGSEEAVPEKNGGSAPKKQEASPQPPEKAIAAASAAPRRFKPFQLEKWMERVEELKAFRRRHGHCLVPHSYPPNPQLSRWCKRQRRQYKLMNQNRKEQGGGSSSGSGWTAATRRSKSTMTPQRAQLLEEMGFCWDVHGATWREKVADLRAYRERHGNCMVPCSYRHNPQLGIWVKSQRQQYKLYVEGKACSMTQERVEELRREGFVFEDTSSAHGKQEKASKVAGQHSNKKSIVSSPTSNVQSPAGGKFIRSGCNTMVAKSA